MAQLEQIFMVMERGRWRLLVALALTFGVAVGVTHAQDADAQEGQQVVNQQERTHDTTAVRPRMVRRSAYPRAVYGSPAYRGSVPNSVQQVRARIARIGSGGDATVRRVIYPVIVPLRTTRVVYLREQGARPSGQGLGEGVPRRYAPPYELGDGGDDERFAYPYFPEEESEEVIVRFRDEGEAPADSAAAPRVDTVRVEVTPPPAEEEPPPVIVRRVERALLNRGLFRTTGVHFEFDQSDILPTFYPTLDAVSAVLHEYPDLRILVAGHTDAIGTEAYNQRLSSRRAQSVATYLIEQGGIDPDRLVTRGYGESRPIATNETPTGRTLNRRVEFRVLNPEAAGRDVDELEQEPGAGENLREALREIIREELERAQADTTGEG